MSLRDHFFPPLSTKRHWHSFHNAWSTYLAENLNQLLPEGYFAEPNVQFGIEIDVATLSEVPLTSFAQQTPESTQWSPRPPTATLPFQPTTDSVEVQIFNTQAGPTLVGAIELVSPANKDRPTHRNAFTSKCQTYLQQSIGLVIVDIVTTLSANLHHNLMQQLSLQTESLKSDLYVVAYRVAEIDGISHLSIWQEPLTIGEPLPMVPLFLKGGIFLPLDLEQTYTYTCTKQRIPDPV
ncbi:DUF4058 family protein [Pseudanabaena sp. PCC 6802]|uniref:DUF4058 family protein n=1 Tax=Pseudanabaena sp. PCC 6802 TaxID=118173 RepID=UPI00034A8F0B|nr:DUF4058 family protein [Pseudanabaena sp. PCC 6802]